MAFHELNALSPAAVAALANTCEALITAEGSEPASQREHQLQQQLFAMLLGRPWPSQVAAAVPAGLSGLITGRRQRQQVLQLLTVLAFLEPRLDQAKVQVLGRVAAELQVEPEVVADLEQVCRKHVLKAFGDWYRRTFHDLNDDGVVQGYARFILPMLGIGVDHAHQQRYEALRSAPAGSFGAALQVYYDHNGFPYPGSRKGLPYDYVAIHDVHHVIGGYGTDPEGELEVLAFAVALQRGAAASGPIRDFHWDFWPWIERPLDAVRRDLQVAG